MTLNALPAWADNTNYSAGPDVGTPTKVDPSSAANGFVKGVVAAPQHINFLVHAIVAELVKALDGVNGGTYTLVAPIVFDGEDVQIAGDLRILPGGDIEVDAGADINIEGDVHLRDGATLYAQSGVAGGTIRLLTQSRLKVDSGADVVLEGTITGASGAVIKVEAPGDIVIDNQGVTFRVNLTPMFIAGSPGNPDWIAEPSGTFLMRTVGGNDAFIGFALNLRPGDTLITLVMHLEGGAYAGHGTPPNPDDMPLFELVSVSQSGVATVIKQASDPVTGAAYDSPHSVTMAGGLLPYLVTTDPLMVRVLTEGGAGSVPNTTRLCSIDGTLVARSYRGANEIY